MAAGTSHTADRDDLRSISNARTPPLRVLHDNFTEARAHGDQTDRTGGRGPPRRRRAPLPLRLSFHLAAGARSMRILIVEDEALIAWMLADSLAAR